MVDDLPENRISFAIESQVLGGTFLKYSRFTSSHGSFPLGEKMDAFHMAPLATITDDAPKSVCQNLYRSVRHEGEQK